MRVRIGACTFDGERRLLLRDGDPVPLSPKGLELLAALVERRPRAVSKRELHERLWPSTFVSPVNLPVLVVELRRALQDRGRPRLIRTVRGFGYALEVEANRDARGCSLFWGTQELSLDAGENVIGRHGPGVIALGDPTVSRRHARILVGDEGATAEDLGSRNGTFLGETRLTAPVPLADGDRLRVGSVVLTFRRAGSGTTAPMPEPE